MKMRSNYVLFLVVVGTFIAFSAITDGYTYNDNGNDNIVYDKEEEGEEEGGGEGEEKMLRIFEEFGRVLDETPVNVIGSLVPQAIKDSLLSIQLQSKASWKGKEERQGGGGVSTQCQDELLALFFSGCLDLYLAPDYATGPRYQMRDLSAFFCFNSECPARVVSTMKACQTDFGITEDDVKAIELQLNIATELLCVSDSNGNFCIMELMDPITDNFIIDFNDIESVTSAELRIACKECYFLWLGNLITLLEPTDAVSSGTFEQYAQFLTAMSLGMCLRDPTKAGQVGEYCVPYLVGSPNCYNTSTHQCFNQLAFNTCEDSICYSSMTALSYNLFPFWSVSERNEYGFALANLCVQSPTNASSYCAIEYFEEDVRIWNDTSCIPVNDTCTTTPACEPIIDSIFDQLGCCEATGFEVYLPLTGDRRRLDIITYNSWLNSYDCNGGLPRDVPFCPTSSATNDQTAVMLAKVDCSYVNKYLTEACNALKNDFSITLGITIDTISSFACSCDAKSNLATVTGSFKSNSDARTTVIVTKSVTFGTYDWFLGSYSIAYAPYHHDHLKATHTKKSSSTFFTTGVIAGIAAGGAGFLILIVGAVVVYKKGLFRRSQGRPLDGYLIQND